MARPKNIESALLDASALIGVIVDDPDFADVGTVLAAVQRGEVRLVESTAILAEVLIKHADDAERDELTRATLRALLESPATELVDVSTPVARKAGELRVRHGLKTWDAVHLATAIVAGVDILVARDGKLQEGEYEGVYVTPPFNIDDDKLFGGTVKSRGVDAPIAVKGMVEG